MSAEEILHRLKSALTREEIAEAIMAMKPLIDQIPEGREVLVKNDGTQEVIYSGLPYYIGRKDNE